MKINANGTEISIMGNITNEEAYISLTDIAKKKNADDPRIVISNWMSSYSTIDFLATWESLYNPGFNRMEFQTVRNEPGRLIMTPKQWIKKTNAYYQLKSLETSNAAARLKDSIQTKLGKNEKQKSL